MYAPERQQTIVDAAREHGRVEVLALAEQLNVTPETVRRDLTALEQRGLVRRVHGGALPVERHDREMPLTHRFGRATAQKRAIAVRAMDEIPSSATVLLDSGTTTQAIAELLPADIELTVVTNSIAIAALLHEHPGVDLNVLGGHVRSRTGAAVGSWVQRALEDVCVDVAFLGTNGFSVDRGFTTPDQVESTAKRAMMTAARRAIVVSDSSKAGQVQMHRFASTTEASMLITDTGLDEETVELFDEAGLDVVRT